MKDKDELDVERDLDFLKRQDAGRWKAASEMKYPSVRNGSYVGSAFPYQTPSRRG
jgi:hypothetical protein